MFSLDQKIKVLQREKDTINRNADERVKLGFLKDALESSKKKLNERHVSFLSLNVLCKFYVHAVTPSLFILLKNHVTLEL